ALTTSGPTAPCDALSVLVTITFRAVAPATAVFGSTACASSPAVQLNGSVGGAASSGTWSGGNGSFSPDASALNATYTPTAAEVAAGSVTLTLTTNDPAGPCGPVSDPMTISFGSGATADAGLDRTACASSPAVQLAGSVGGAATSGTWSGGAGSFSPNASTLNATYTPTAAEVAAGSVTLTLTSNDPAGPCGAASDAMKITFTSGPTANVPDLTVCSGGGAVSLCANAAGGTPPYTYLWNTGATTS